MCQSSMNKKKKKTKRKCNEKTSQSSQEEEQPLEINDNIEQDEDEFDECVETRRGKIPLKMTTEIMGHAVYTWMLLDFRKRWDIPVKFESKLSKTLTNILPALNRKFEEIYSKHTCNKPGCSHPDRTLIADGNLKSTRRLCGADTVEPCILEQIDHLWGLAVAKPMI